MNNEDANELAKAEEQAFGGSSEIYDLRAENAALIESTVKQNERMFEMKAEIESLHKAHDEVDDERRKLRAQLAERDREIAVLKDWQERKRHQLSNHDAVTLTVHEATKKELAALQSRHDRLREALEIIRDEPYKTHYDEEKKTNYWPAWARGLAIKALSKDKADEVSG